MPMPELSKERMGEIAMIVLLSKTRRDGITLKPTELKRQAVNEARRLGLGKVEAMQFAKIIAIKIFEESMTEIDSIIKKGEE